MSRLIRTGKRLIGEYRSIVPDAKRGLRRIALGTNSEAAHSALRALKSALTNAAAGLPVSLDELPILIRDRYYEECRLAGLRLAIGEAAQTPLLTLANEWKANIEARNRTKKYARKQHYRVKRLIEGCKFMHWRDLSASAVETQLAAWRLSRKKPLSLQTSNHYIGAMKTFATWCVAEKGLGVSPFLKLGKMNSNVDRKHVRRVFTQQELVKLLEAAAAGEPFFGISGAARAMLYRTAVESGLRARELRTLTVRSFRLTGPRPYVKVKAGYAKGGREDDQPLRPAFAAELLEYFAGRQPHRAAFRMPEEWRLIDMLKADLLAAGIDYEDEDGHVLDFHAFRHTYITNLARAGVQPKVCQKLARHSTITLTFDYYTHATLSDLHGAVASLPDPNVGMGGADSPAGNRVRNSATGGAA